MTAGEFDLKMHEADEKIIQAAIAFVQKSRASKTLRKAFTEAAKACQSGMPERPNTGDTQVIRLAKEKYGLSPEQEEILRKALDENGV